MPSRPNSSKTRVAPQGGTLIFMNDFCGGGAQIGLANALEAGFGGPSVHVVALITGDGLALPRFRALPHVTLTTLFPSQRMRLAHMLRGLVAYPLVVWRQKPKAVILSLPQANAVGRIWAHVLRVPHYVFEHSTRYRTKAFEYLLPWLSYPVAGVLADCQGTLNVVLAKYRGTRTRHNAVVPLTVAEPRPQRTAYALKGAVHLASAGRLVPEKNFGAVIQAVALLQKKGINATYTLYGEGPLKAELAAQAKALGIAKSITFAGFVDDFPSQLAKADIYLQPSTYEGLCITALQAMNTGIPVIASPVGGLLEYATAHETYLPVATPAAETIAQAVQALSEDEALRRRMGQGAQARIQALYAPQAAHRAIAVVNNVLGV